MGFGTTNDGTSMAKSRCWSSHSWIMCSGVGLTCCPFSLGKRHISGLIWWLGGFANVIAGVSCNFSVVRVFIVIDFWVVRVSCLIGGKVRIFIGVRFGRGFIGVNWLVKVCYYWTIGYRFLVVMINFIGFSVSQVHHKVQSAKYSLAVLETHFPQPKK